MDGAIDSDIKNDMRRWQMRKDKQTPKAKHHILKVMTAQALQRAKERNVRVRDIVEGRAQVKQLLTPDGRYITIIPR